MKNENKHLDKVWDKNIIDKMITPISSLESKEVVYVLVNDWIDSKTLPKSDGYVWAWDDVSGNGEKAWFDDQLPKSFQTKYSHWLPIPISPYSSQFKTSPIEVIKKRLEERIKVLVKTRPRYSNARINELLDILKLIK